MNRAGWLVGLFVGLFVWSSVIISDGGGMMTIYSRSKIEMGNNNFQSILHFTPLCQSIRALLAKSGVIGW